MTHNEIVEQIIPEFKEHRKGSERDPYDRCYAVDSKGICTCGTDEYNRGVKATKTALLKALANGVICGVPDETKLAYHLIDTLSDKFFIELVLNNQRRRNEENALIKAKAILAFLKKGSV